MNDSLADLSVAALAAVQSMGKDLTNDHPERHQVRILKRHAETAIATSMRLAIELAYQAEDLSRTFREVEAAHGIGNKA